MHFSLLINVGLPTLACFFLLCHAAPHPPPTVVKKPPPQATDLFVSISPASETTIVVGDNIHVQVHVKDEEFRKFNPDIWLTLQRAIPMPDVNENIAIVALSKLEKHGYSFEAKEAYLGDPERTNRYRVRYSFHEAAGSARYVDSDIFHLSPA
ncbi:hypothetical protein BGZ98_007240 [Dissophora globulifera]|nr:hypothetical protein BGZ98_007240 [Dissophora globulifera]